MFEKNPQKLNIGDDAMDGKEFVGARGAVGGAADSYLVFLCSKFILLCRSRIRGHS